MRLEQEISGNPLKKMGKTQRRGVTWGYGGKAEGVEQFRKN